LRAFTAYGQQSVFLGIAAKTNSANRALSVLGNPQIHNLVLAMSLGETFVGVESTIMMGVPDLASEL
jgi:HD-like signal output (HDOD) protein